VLLIQALVEVFSVFATFAAVLLVDRIGRRVTLLIGVGVMIASNALLVVLYAISSHFTGAAPTLGFIGILFFTAGFKPSGLGRWSGCTHRRAFRRACVRSARRRCSPLIFSRTC
jgi:MFS family permease